MCIEDLKLHLKDKIQEILDETFTDINKRRIRDKHSELLIACPVCGDSLTDTHKKRGYFYFDSMKYHCFNGECIAKYWDALYFMKSFDKRIGNLDYIKQISNILKESKTNREHLTLHSSSEYFKFLNDNALDAKSLISHYKLKPYSSYDWSIQFIKDRLLHNIKHDLLFRVNKWKKREVWILNKIGIDKVVGLQIKNLDGGAKYLTKDFSTLNEELSTNIEYVNDKEFKSTCDNLSLIFNIFNVNLEKTITVFEGPLDSVFINNSVATAGASKLKTFFDDVDNIRYFYDNDKTGKSNSITKIKNKKPCFLWSKFFKDFKYTNKKIKDLNELITYVYANREYSNSLNQLSSYYSKIKYDIYYV